jgi:DNA-binding XRE family transcriptional regulator
MNRAAGTVRKSDSQLEPRVRIPDGPPSVDFIKKDIDREIGRKLRAARHRVSARGWSYVHFPQEDIAQVLGLQRPAISEIEAGRRRLTAAELVLLAEYFRVPVAELLPP